MEKAEKSVCRESGFVAETKELLGEDVRHICVNRVQWSWGFPVHGMSISIEV